MPNNDEFADEQELWEEEEEEQRDDDEEEERKPNNSTFGIEDEYYIQENIPAPPKPATPPPASAPLAKRPQKPAQRTEKQESPPPEQREQNTRSALVPLEEYAILKSLRVGRFLARAVGPRGLTLGDIDVITVPAGTSKTPAWEFPTAEGSQLVRSITGVVLYHREQRAYWSKTQSDRRPPDCFSFDTITGLGSPGGSCAACPLSRPKSAGDGKKGQACRLRWNLYMVRPQDALPFILCVPPTSLRNVKAAFRRLALSGIPYHAAVLRFQLERVEAAETSYYQITCRAVQPIQGTPATPEQVSLWNGTPGIPITERMEPGDLWYPHDEYRRRMIPILSETRNIPTDSTT